MMKAYVFDAYGTLFDVHSAVRSCAINVGPQADRLSEIWRAKQLEYTWVLTLSGVYENFETLTAQALDFALEKCGIYDISLRADLLAAYDQVAAFPEVKETLRSLKAKGAKLAILSNGTPRMLNAAVANAGLSGLFDALFSVDTIKKFKPDKSTYALACDGLKLRPNEISFQSSNRWDIAGATQFGFRAVWINRTNQPDEYPGLPAQMTLSSLTELDKLT